MKCILTTTVLHFNFSNSNCRVHKFIYPFCVHLTLCVCASFCPVEQLIVGHMINMANTLIRNLCDRKKLQQPMFSHRLLNTLNWYLWMHSTRHGKLHHGAVWFLMQNLQLFHLSA